MCDRAEDGAGDDEELDEPGPPTGPDWGPRDGDGPPSYDPGLVGSFDPNDIVGPTGYGEDGWIPAAAVLPYRINFENKSDATAPAQLVTISHHLDPDLDWRTFRLGGFGWGEYYFDGAEGRSFYSERLDLTADYGFVVDAVASINVATGEAFWSLKAVDPETGDYPEDALAGFLPPGNEDRPVVVNFGRIEDLTFSSDNPVRVFTAREWLDTDATPDSLTAPWLGVLNIAVDRRNDVDGDFAASLNLTAPGVPFSAKRIRVVGDVTAGTWDIEGDVGSVSVASTSAGWTLAAEGEVKTLICGGALGGSLAAHAFGRVIARGGMSADLTAEGQDVRGTSLTSLATGGVNGSAVNLAGGARAVNVAEWTGGSLTADWVNVLVSRGDFTADVFLRGDASAPRTLGSARIRGNVGSGDPVAPVPSKPTASGRSGSRATAATRWTETSAQT